MSQPKVVLISGAAGDLGRVLAADLGAAGYRLALLGSSEARLETLRQALTERSAGGPGIDGERVMVVPADLRDATAAALAVERVVGRFARIDVLAHLVGGWTGGTPIVDSGDEPYASMLDQHLWTSLNLIRAVVPGMLRSGHGRVVAVSSPVVDEPRPGMGAYAVAKAAQEALFATLAREVVGTGVTVNVVRVRAIDAEHRRDAVSPDQRHALTTPEEICAAVRFLLSDQAGVVNGQRIGLHSGV